MRKTGGRPTGGAVGELERDLKDAITGVDGVDRHGDLHAIAGREGQQVAQQARPHGPLPRERRTGGQATAATDRPAGERERDPKPAGRARGERRHGQLGLASADRIDKLRQLAGAEAEVAVAQDDDRATGLLRRVAPTILATASQILAVNARGRVRARARARYIVHPVNAVQSRRDGHSHRLPLTPAPTATASAPTATASPTPAIATTTIAIATATATTTTEPCPYHPRPRALGDLSGSVCRPIVGDPNRGIRKRARKPRERCRDALGLVAGSDDREHTGAGHVVAGHAAIVPDRYRHGKIGGASVAEVEAHITGTVWKIECEVGDEIEEGDTLVILESMKMEMPVEAEDPGKVSEILCEEGQAVSEGDTLVVLE